MFRNGIIVLSTGLVSFAITSMIGHFRRGIAQSLSRWWAGEGTPIFLLLFVFLAAFATARWGVNLDASAGEP